MRRITLILLSLILAVALCMPVYAANFASAIQMTANVSGDESCQVTIVATFHVEENDGKLYFPVPLEAKAVTLNGSRVRTTRSGQARNINLSKVIKNMTGDFTVTVGYSLPDVIEAGEAGQPQLQLPMLSGYKNSVSQLDFTVTMPGQILAKPAFSSGYHQSGIEEYITSSVSGSTVTGSSLKALKDHETLTMTLDADPEVFSVAPLELNESNADDIGMIVCGVLAVLYWLIFLRALPPIGRSTAAVPERFSAGEMEAVMALGRADLSLMAFSWAQMGYLQMQVSKKRVILVRQMDMGNERSSFEQRCFKKLFDRRSSVDTSGLFYANLCRAVKKMQPELQPLVKPSSGNVRVFRALAALVGLFGGVSLGMAMTSDAALKFFGIFFMAVIGGLCGWFMQQPAGELFLRKSNKTAWGLIFTAIWLIFSLIAGQFNIGLIVLLVQWVAGILALFGGRRTEEGKQELSRLMGLRMYFLTVSKEELRRISGTDPEYFHKVAPYALALGVGSQFAARFGKGNYAQCPYITVRSEKIGSARQWSELMEQSLSGMNRRSRILPLERLIGVMAAARSERPERRKKRPEENEN